MVDEAKGEPATTPDAERRARTICVGAGQDPYAMVLPGVDMPGGYRKPIGPARPWWTFKLQGLAPPDGAGPTSGECPS